MFKKVVVVLFLVLVPSMMFAGTVGKISGTITDRETGDALPGANVFIDGTTLGAATDVEGRFIILNVPVGTYIVRASFIGYQTFTIRNVIVSQDLTTEVNIGLPTEAIEVASLFIIAERPLVNKNATNSIINISGEKMRDLPIRGYQNVAGLSAGVVQVGGTLFVRGGRAEETAFYVDGVYQNNAFDLTRAGQIIDNSVEEVQFQGGGFNAEYGFANSGIIFATTKTGGRAYKISGEIITDEFLSSDNDDFLGTFGYGQKLYNIAFSGPFPGFEEKLSFYAAIERRDDTGGRKTNGFHAADIANDGTVILKGGPLPNSADESWNWNGNIRLNFQNIKFKLGGNSTRRDRNRFINSYSLFNSARNPVQRFDTDSYYGKVTHTLNPNTFWTATASWFRDEFEEADPVHGNDFLNYGDLTDINGDGITNSALRLDGSQPALSRGLGEYVPAGFVFDDYTHDEQSFWGLKADITRQQGRSHEIGAGFEYRRNTIRHYRIIQPIRLAGLLANNADLRGKILSNTATDDEVFSFYSQAFVDNIGYDLTSLNELNSGRNGAPHPILFSAYIQDKIELKDLVVNIGLRYDRLDPDADQLADPTNIVIERSQIAESNFISGATHSQLSPRLGFSFPVNDQTVFHAQYGKFLQQPKLENLILSSNVFAPFLTSGNFTVSANPALKPERTTAYEVGFRRQVGDNAALDITAFYKDIDDFIQIREIRAKPVTYARYENGDFGTIKGLALTFDMRRTNRVAVSGNYTLQFASGTGSNEDDARNIAWLGGNFPTFTAPLDFDQRHTGAINFDFRTNPTDGPGNGRILGNVGANLLFTFGSGRRFTPTKVVSTIFEQQGDTPDGAFNSGTLPWTYQLNLKLDKRFTVGSHLDFSAYIWLLNLTDTENVRTVVLASGRPDVDGWLNTPSGEQYLSEFGGQAEGFYNSRVNSPLRYEIPRQIRLGLLFNIQ